VRQEKVDDLSIKWIDFKARGDSKFKRSSVIIFIFEYVLKIYFILKKY
jgi:hypothetical protein